MKAEEIRDLTTAEIEQQVKSLKEELFNLRFMRGVSLFVIIVSGINSQKRHYIDDALRLVGNLKAPSTAPL